jgi:hypothetical protein
VTRIRESMNAIFADLTLKIIEKQNGVLLLAVSMLSNLSWVVAAMMFLVAVLTGSVGTVPRKLIALWTVPQFQNGFSRTVQSPKI